MRVASSNPRILLEVRARAGGERGLWVAPPPQNSAARMAPACARGSLHRLPPCMPAWLRIAPPLLQFYRPAVAHTVYSLALDFADVYSSQFKVVRLLATSPF